MLNIPPPQDSHIVVPASQVKNSFGEIVTRVLRGERIAVSRHGRVELALISIDDLELLEALEMREDLRTAEAARAVPGKHVAAEEFFESLKDSPSRD